MAFGRDWVSSVRDQSSMGNILGTSHPPDGIDSGQEIQEEAIRDISDRHDIQ